MEQSVVLRNAQVKYYRYWTDIHGQLRMRTTVPFGKKTMLSTFHIDKIINNNKELFTRHLLWTITITIIIIEHSTRWLVLSTVSRSNWDQQCQFLSMEKNQKTWRKRLEQGQGSNLGHVVGGERSNLCSIPTPRSPFIYQCYDIFGTINCQFSKNENQSYDNSQLESRWTSA